MRVTLCALTCTIVRRDRGEARPCITADPMVRVDILIDCMVDCGAISVVAGATVYDNVAAFLKKNRKSKSKSRRIALLS